MFGVVCQAVRIPIPGRRDCESQNGSSASCRSQDTLRKELEDVKATAKAEVIDVQHGLSTQTQGAAAVPGPSYSTNTERLADGLPLLGQFLLVTRFRPTTGTQCKN